MLSHYRAFTYDVMAAIVVFQNKETVAILEYEAIFFREFNCIFMQNRLLFFVNQYDRWSTLYRVNIIRFVLKDITHSVNKKNKKTTVEPLLGGHPRGNSNWPLNRGWPLVKGSSETSIMHFKMVMFLQYKIA